MSGYDLNRRRLKPNEIVHPEIYYAKEMILKLTNIRDIAFIIDSWTLWSFLKFLYAYIKVNKRIWILFPYNCSKLNIL